ncbi:MAG: cobalamin-dependent protein [Lachnospiraceae bacterium]|nr:cobalamin-dependent protein [Lachnospiraceae bacterium]MDY5497578.1 cobalamin-dependent protein [Anaerobutyricum sp.]
MGETINEIIDSLKRGQGKRVANLVKMALEEGISSQEILEEGFLAGMQEVADRFRQEEVGVPEILSITRALDRGVSTLRHYSTEQSGKDIGTVVIGTVRGDLHDIGKNLVKLMMESKNIRVIDLGVDVSPGRFLDEALGSHAQIVCMSGIMPNCGQDMRAVVEEFELKGVREQFYFMVGGYFLTEKQAREIGADCYTEDACSCAEKACRYLTKKDRKKKR